MNFRGTGFQPVVAVLRDIDRYSDRISKSEAIFLFDTEIAPLLLYRLRRCSRVRESTG